MIRLIGEETAVSEEVKVVQRETHILEGKKRSLAVSEKGNMIEGEETLVEGKKEGSVGGSGEFGGEGKGKFGDGEEVELCGGEEG